MSIGNDPRVLGADLVAANSTALALLSTNGLTVGTECFNEAVGGTFRLRVSTASLVTDQVVAAAGLSNGRWILDVIAPATTSTNGLLPSTGVPLGLIKAASFHSFCSLGADASGGATHITATGVKVGDTVESVLDITDRSNVSADFETTVTVANQIQQTAVDLSAKTLVIRVIANS